MCGAGIAGDDSQKAFTFWYSFTAPTVPDINGEVLGGTETQRKFKRQAKKNTVPQILSKYVKFGNSNFNFVSLGALILKLLLIFLYY